MAPALIQPLVWKPPDVSGAAPKRLKKKVKRGEAGRAPAGQASFPLLTASTMYLCSLRQVHHGVWLQVVLVLLAEHGSDDNDDDPDHSDGHQHLGIDPQVVAGGFLNRAVGNNQGEACDEEHGEGKSHLSPMDFPMIKRRMRKMDWRPCSPLAMSMSQKRRNLRISVVLQSGDKGH